MHTCTIGVEVSVRPYVNVSTAHKHKPHPRYMNCHGLRISHRVWTMPEHPYHSPGRNYGPPTKTSRVPGSKPQSLSGYIIDIVGSAVVGIIATILLNNLRIIEENNMSNGVMESNSSSL